MSGNYADSVMTLGKALKIIRELEAQLEALTPFLEDSGSDSDRMKWLSDMTDVSVITACFDIDGGVFLTIEQPSREAVFISTSNHLREAIDKAMNDPRLKP
ncbi:hypothetical protein [Dyella caseinilytica]|uniref:Uncharacterized protein n=1 Tax=Dyella caseinilytica TaxID=1849581 RepID=A0ABX7GZF8_9GAMM|nr:hypothetical protein [Dyella caseinilytica]QRN55209.1 hypothetical protein ISN74_07735 [Dyella caseinilytica]GGA00140.1 hypothetical protein GCM10011408_21220 [Dyella caseinilytica]